MSPRLSSKIAVVTGAGQSEGEGIGNGRAEEARFITGGVLPVDGGQSCRVG